MPTDRERGFTILEVLVAAGIAVLVLFVAFEAIRQLAQVARTIAQRHHDYAALDALVDRWQTEARTAEAITVPDASCAEVEFTTRDPGPAQPPVLHFWSYRYDAGARTITRYASDAGAIAPCATAGGDIVATGISAFRVAPALVSGLAGRGDSPFVITAGASNAAVPLGVFEADGATPIAAGNTIVEIAVNGPVSARVADLLPGVQPSGYTLLLQYSCASPRCAPSAPHDGSRVDTCGASYALASAPYPTHYALVRPSDPSPKPLPPPGTPATQPFYWPDQWGVSGAFLFHYTGADVSDRYDPFGVVVPGDPADPAAGYVPAFVAPHDANVTADELLAHYAVFTSAIATDAAACDAMRSAVPVYVND